MRNPSVATSLISQSSQHAPNIHHLNLRYLRKITSASLESIASGLKQLYSLDVSFCVKLSDTSVGGLLLDLPGLSELRLFSCTQLSVDGIMTWWTRALMAGRSCLSVLDLRGIHRIPRDSLRFLTDANVEGDFRPFDEYVDNYFTRDARWEKEAEKEVKDELKKHMFSKAGLLGRVLGAESFQSFGSNTLLCSGIINTNMLVNSPVLAAQAEAEDEVVGIEI